MSACLGVTTLFLFLESWSDTQVLAEQTEKQRLYSIHLQRCEATWPLRQTNYKACVERVRL